MSMALQAGDIHLRKMELCGNISVPASSNNAHGSCSLSAQVPPFLKTISKSFERIKWLSVTITYRSAVSMTQAGLVTVGVDWNWETPKSTRQDVSAYSPTQTCPVFKELTMVLPPSRLQSRLWYSTKETSGVDAGPGQIIWAVDATTGPLTLGELWITYDVVLSGTTA